MAKYKLHWMDRRPDPNIRRSTFDLPHVHRPRISSQTILSLFTLKSELQGVKLDIFKEAEEFALKSGY